MQHESETTIVLASWYNGSLTEEAETANNHLFPNDTNAYTINGLTGNYSTWTCPNVDETDKAFNMTVNSGKTYLLRIVNAVMNEDMFFSIANHNITVVGIDGAYVEPINTNYIMIGPGNTMDALVTADKVNPSNYYYMAASTFHYGVGGNTVIRNATAVLIYNGSHPTPPPVFPSETLPVKGDFTKANDFINSINISSTIEQRAPSGDMDHSYIIDVSVFPSATNVNASLNNISFVLPTDGQESLLNTSFGCITNVQGQCDGIEPFPTQTAGNLIMNGKNMIVVNYNQTVEIVFIGSQNGAEDHPMHLHGHSFYLVGRGFNETFDNVTSRENFDFENAPLLNTVGVPYLGWAAIRFYANNPGVWFIHCHLERHASWGMATVIIVREGEKKMIKRPDDMPSCSAT